MRLRYVATLHLRWVAVYVANVAFTVTVRYVTLVHYGAVDLRTVTLRIDLRWTLHGYVVARFCYFAFALLLIYARVTRCAVRCTLRYVVCYVERLLRFI